ncbi:aspartate carbamoyltransferase catalytic subunit [Thalassococcus lentus]|uniref:Aspartate carbamoyltransferase catalytic subunit n=1 Tax=Thalassococcus lentus TaxID=1210524 RepID=A0ABT4XMN6_9RHOB|nr:aspartate carbamoyltransferase catalytic subunit [Thalassococcus lentus]MDA7423204.1 aspartate carbamoyltransferase catalytic subunit [Thalassococcus lentus]
MSSPASVMQTDWDGLLDQGERVLWQGRPEAGLTLAPIQPMQMMMGLVFVVFSLFWMSMAGWIASGMPGPVSFFPMFGLIFLAIGLYNAGGYAFWKAYLRGRTVYSLTTQRAFVASDIPFLGRSLKSYDIEANSPLEYIEGNPGSVFFANKRIHTQNGSYRKRVGFERIMQARAVYRMLRDIQRGTIAEDNA